MEGMRQLPDPNPELCTDELTGADMSEPLARLAGSEIDTLTVDGFRILGVDDVDPGRDSGITTVICTDETGARHRFTYRPDSGSPVFHDILAD